MDKHLCACSCFFKPLLCSMLLLAGTCLGQNPKGIAAFNADRVFAVKSQGNILWIGTFVGLIRLDKTTERLTVYTEGNSNLADDHIASIAIDSTGLLWIGTRDGAAARFNGTDFKAVNSSTTGVWMDQWVTEIEIDSVGKVWLCAERNLLISNLNTWKTFLTAWPYIGFSQTSKLVFDKTGTPWLGTDWGLGKFVGDTVLTKYDGFVNHINSLAVDRNNALWLAEYGLVKYDGETKTFYNTGTAPLPSNLIWDLKFDSKGVLWFPCGQFLGKYDGVSWQFFPCDFGEDGAYRIEIDENDIIWLGTLGNGVYRFDGVNWKHYSMLVTSVPAEPSASSAPGYQLFASYPNPFNSMTTIRYRLPVASKVSLKIINSLGQVVATLVEAEQAQGSYQVSWNSSAASGLYFCRLEAGGFTDTRKLILLK